MNQLKVAYGAQNLSVENFREAEKSITRFEQKCYFSQELALLEHGRQVEASSSICKLDPIVDERMLRVGGRISKLAMPIDLKNPIILPKDSHISKLILQHIHQQTGHSSHMLSRLNQRFWLPHANSSARKIIKNCVLCQRMQATVGEQKMADLPEDRVYFGPIEVR